MHDSTYWKDEQTSRNFRRLELFSYAPPFRGKEFKLFLELFLQFLPRFIFLMNS